MITQKILHDLFILNENGDLIRKENCGKAKARKKYSSKDRDGYLVMRIDGKTYFSHRLVWLYVHGTFPSGVIDHINRIKTDNRPENLRDVTRSENRQNTIAQKNNKSGYKGIWWHKQNKNWCASICVDGKQKHIGCFKTAEEAHLAYQKEASTYHTMNAMAINR